MDGVSLSAVRAHLVGTSGGFNGRSHGFIVAVITVFLATLMVVEETSAGIRYLVRVVASVTMVAEVEPAEGGEFMFAMGLVSKRDQAKGERRRRKKNVLSGKAG